MIVKTTALFDKWLNKIKDKRVLIAVHGKLDKIKNDSHLGKIYPVREGISEIKIEMGAGYRLYFNVYIKDENIIFLSAGDKSTQNEDIEKAILLLKEFKKEMTNEQTSNNYKRRR